MSHAIHWFEIFVGDIERAARFYQTVLGVELRRAEEDGRPMAIFASAVEDGVGGALVQQAGRAPTDGGALVYLDAGGKLDACLARVEHAGGRVVQGKTDIGPPGFIALVRDSEGNVVGLHSERRAKRRLSRRARSTARPTARRRRARRAARASWPSTRR